MQIPRFVGEFGYLLKKKKEVAMVILLFLVTCYCYRQHLKTKNWLEEQRHFYFARTWYWEHYPEEFESERIHFH